MILYIGADHRGFELKESLKKFLKDEGYTVEDMGDESYVEKDDFVNFAKYVAEKVDADPVGSRGVLICGSGLGMAIAANKFVNVRSSLVFNADQAAAARGEDDANIISLAADYVDEETAKRLVSVWLQTPFSGEERYKRRIQELRDLGNSIH